MELISVPKGNFDEDFNNCN